MKENLDLKVINEKSLDDYPGPITSDSTEIILNQMRKNICKIYLNDGNKATGFFCKIPFWDKDQFLPILITNNLETNNFKLNDSSKIILTINDDKIKKYN